MPQSSAKIAALRALRKKKNASHQTAATPYSEP